MDDARMQAVRLLMVEDQVMDAERTLYHLKRGGLDCDALRVQTGPALTAALAEFSPNLIISDFSLPQFDGLSALQICRDRAPHIPFIFLSGTIGEERAIAALQAGASDYVLKDNMARLVPAARRALDDARARAERGRQEAQIERLNRLLRMLKDVNDVAMRCRDRSELLAETCRLAIAHGACSMAVAATRTGGGAAIKVLASHGLDAQLTAALAAHVENSGARPPGIVAEVFASGREFVCNDAMIETPAELARLMALTGGRPLALLPLQVDGETAAVLLLVTQHGTGIAGEELAMLRDLARSLSFDLQYVHRDVRARFLSHFDPHTGIARRSLFCDRVRDLLAAGAARSAGHAVVMVDVRRLSAINDSFGRHVGDRLLRRIAEALKRGVPKQEHLGHFGGGTFALLLQASATSAAGVQSQLQRQMQALLGRPFEIDGHSIPVSLRIGFAIHPEDADEARSLIQNAETALQVARASGQPLARFDPKVQSQGVGRLALEHRLRAALEKQEFELFYQPKVNVVTRRIEGAEALLRWRSPEEGLMTPDAFLPVLESSGLIVPVGQWVTEQAARDGLQWKNAGLPPLHVAVNVAPAQIQQPDFEQHLLQLARQAGPGRMLDLEITEGVLQEDCVAETRKLERLRAAGFRIAIDDFGTGYSSLSRLSRLPVDTLKIDRNFISQMVHNPTGATVVKTVVVLARAFGMTSVAEGVERQEELDLLWQMGCDQSQGFLHSRAVTATEFAELLRNGRGVLIQPPAHEAGGEESAS